jgi:hypothetical protein
MVVMILNKTRVPGSSLCSAVTQLTSLSLSFLTSKLKVFESIPAEISFLKYNGAGDFGS